MGYPARAMLKLRRLRVEKFRSVAKGAELSLSDGINVLLGQNGTGKTTLLELAKSGFPAREAYDVKKSFAESVDRLLACDGLTRALARTHG
jgi:Fe-S cluster assembly ATPase SufC